MPWLRRTYPWLYPRYVELYGGRAYAPRAYQEEVVERFARLRLRHGIGGGASRPVTKPAEKGTGLGLSIVKRLVCEANGAVHVHTKIGQGSTFTVCLQTRQ